MDFNEFAELVKSKHPEYKDRDNLALATAMVNKFPQYKERVDLRVASPGSETILTNLPTGGILGDVARHSPSIAAGIAGGMEGATMGAAAGTAFGPAGTVIGGALGGIGGAAIGGFSGEAARQAGVAAKSALQPEKKYPTLPPTRLISALNRQALEQAKSQAAGEVIGASMPAVKAVGGKLAEGFEGLSGLEYKSPGALKEAAEDASLIFGPSKKEAGLAYEAIKDDLQIRPSMLESTSNSEIIRDAKYALENGDLTPQEALIARQAVDDSYQTLPKSSARRLRDKFDSVAKQITSDADAGFKRAIKSDAIRKILATNKGGGTSIAKLVLGGFTGGALNIASSPVVQGAAATGIGMAGRALESSPDIIRGAALRALLEKRDKHGQ